MKKRPQTPLAYAQYLYMAAHCNGAVSTMTDTDIISARVRAFVDGVNWQKRQSAKKRRAS